jgi:two-component system sensor histidine kinase MprB
VSLRLRIAAVGGVAVALAVLAAAVGIYLAVRSDLRGQIDQSLTQRAQEFVRVPLPSDRGALPDDGIPAAIGANQRALRARLDGHGPLPNFVQPGRFGGAAGYVQFVSAKGVVEVPGGQGSTPKIPPSASDRQIAASGHGSALSDRTVRGTHLRVLTLGTPTASGAQGTGTPGAAGGGAVMIARPLSEVDHDLHRILLILLIVGVAGIALGAVLGALVARTALAPIARFTRRTESLAGELDLSERLDVSGGEELERLATSFNTTLDALERSLLAQRQLIADASHELRTPIASLRANIQTLEDAHRLAPAEQQRLRADIIDELDELTTLVGDVVELARGSRAPSERGEVRLDELADEAVARTRRRGEVHFELDLQPTVVRGEADRINRAISNLLDNARKWSPPSETVDVAVHGGLVEVRDRGPGIAAEDAPLVFNRFYRSKVARGMPGAGLGLSIVKQIADAHGGSVSIDQADGGGAILRLKLSPTR